MFELKKKVYILIIVINFFIYRGDCSVITEADTLQISEKNSICELIGNAHVQYTVKDNLYDFKSDLIILKYKKDHCIQKIESFKGVSFQFSGLKITANSCIFINNKVKFMSDVVILDEKFGKIIADEAVYDIDTKIIDVSSKSKVVLTINKDLK